MYMKILVISNMYPSDEAPNYGTFVRNFCIQLEQLNIDYDKVVMTKKSKKVVAIFSYLFYYIRIFLTVLFRTYDLIYVHYASHSAIPLLLLNKIKKNVIYTNVHGGDVIPQTNMQIKMQKYAKRLLKISSKIVVPSRYFKALMIEMYNIPENKIYIYPSAGVNKAIFYPYSEQEKKGISIKNKKINGTFKYIGYVGRIENGKGWDTFLKALKILKNRDNFEKKRAIVVGMGNQYNEFLNMINEFGLSDDIILVEALPQNKLSDIYNVLSIFCFPTKLNESLGLVALEALACSVPVIASDFAAPKEYIIDGYNGYKFEKGNQEELANKIDEFFKLSIEETKQIQRNAYKTGAKYYSDNFKREFQYLFKDLIPSHNKEKMQCH